MTTSMLLFFLLASFLTEGRTLSEASPRSDKDSRHLLRLNSTQSEGLTPANKPVVIDQEYEKLRNRSVTRLGELHSWFAQEIKRLKHLAGNHQKSDAYARVGRLEEDFQRLTQRLSIERLGQDKKQAPVKASWPTKVNYTGHEEAADEISFIQDLVEVFTAAAVGGLGAGILGQPIILGYIFGGIVVGPGGLGLIKAHLQVDSLAQFGVAFLLFALGVEFSPAYLRQIQPIAVGSGILQMTLTTVLTAVVARLWGWCETMAEAVLLGACLSFSSTAVVLRCLIERKEIASSHGQVMLGILVVQDLAVAFLLAILPALQRTGMDAFWLIVREMYYLILLVVAAGLVAYWIMPSILNTLAHLQSPELFLLTIVVLCLGVATFTEFLGLSIEMGSFVAGIMIAENEVAGKVLQMITPLRDIFASMFFVCVGMLIDPLFLIENLLLIGLLVAFVFIGKVLVTAPLIRTFRYHPRVAIYVGLGLAQVGEFSFVVASKGQRLGLISNRVHLLLAGTTACTLIMAPFTFKFAERLCPDVGPILTGAGSAAPRPGLKEVRTYDVKQP